MIAWERCRAVLLRKLAASDLKMRLSADQVRLTDEMRNTMLIRMYARLRRSSPVAS